MTFEADPNPDRFVHQLRRATIEVRWRASTAGQNVWVSQFADAGGVLVLRGTNISDPPLILDWQGTELKYWALVEPWNGGGWNAVNTSSWLTMKVFGGIPHPLDPPSVLHGDGDVFLSASPNPSTVSRTATIVVFEKTYIVTQLGRPE